MKHYISIITIIAIGLMAGTALAGCSPSPSAPTFAEANNLAGAWVGESKPIVLWARAKTIPIAIVVQPNGEVSGKWGDATIVGGKVEKRGFVGSWFWPEERGFLAKVRLRGNIIDAEQIRRDYAYIIFQKYEDGEWRKAGVNSSGSNIGGKNTMILSTTGLVLRKQGHESK
jgi:hypothetical protein